MRTRGLFGQIEILSCGLKLNPSRLDNVVIIRRLLEIFGSAETDTIPLRGGISKDGGKKSAFLTPGEIRVWKQRGITRNVLPTTYLPFLPSLYYFPAGLVTR